MSRASSAGRESATVVADVAKRSLVSERNRAMACEPGEASPPIDSEKTDESMMLAHPARSELAQLPAPRIEGHTQPAEVNLLRSTSSAASEAGGRRSRWARWAAAAASACSRAACSAAGVATHDASSAAFSRSTLAAQAERGGSLALADAPSTADGAAPSTADGAALGGPAAMRGWGFTRASYCA